MKLQARLRQAYKLSNLQNPHKTSLKYFSAVFSEDRKAQETPEFNEYLTSLAANLCNTSLQNGTLKANTCKLYSTDRTIQNPGGEKKPGKVKKSEPSSSSYETIQGLLERHDKFESQVDALATSSTVTSKEPSDKKRDPHIVCVADDKKGCISPGLADNPLYIPKKTAEVNKPKETGPLDLLDSELYKKSLKEAEKRRKQMAKASAACKETKVPKTSEKSFESLTEPSSSFKCGGSKPKSAEQKPTNSPCKGSSELNKPCQEPSKCDANDPTEKKASSSKSETSASASKCGSTSELIKGTPKPKTKLDDACKILQVSKANSGADDPCKVEISASASPLSSCKPETKKSTSASDCFVISKPEKCSSSNKESKCFPKCVSSNSCVKPKKKSIDADAQQACIRAAELKCKSKKSCDSEPANPCKSSCDSMNQSKVKCGRPSRGDTRPRCKKDTKCVDKSSKPKCESKACGPSPKPSKTEIKPKSMHNHANHKPKTAPSSKPPERDYHTLSNVSAPLNLMFIRKFSDDCPDKPKSDYQPKSKRSNEYRLETCENFSWKATKPRQNRTETPKNCYPNETLEFCPDTACYKVYAETSGKVHRKKPKGNSKANKIEKHEALCSHQKRQFSSKARENEEALIQRPHRICTRKVILPDFTKHDALICVDSVALSDSDIHMFETGAKNTQDLTLGNEAAGVVMKVQKRNICNLKPGDHVVLESGVPCFKCDLCKMGRYNICNNINFRGFLKNYCLHPASFCHKIDPSIPLEQAALVSQLALGCNACHQAGIKSNSNVAIIGSCAMTVCAAMCALSMGAENVCVMCGMRETRVLVEQFVTQKVDSFDSTTIERGIVRMIMTSLGTSPDIVINCSGCTRTMNAAIIALKPSGVCVVAGFSSECACFNIMDALVKEILIVPSFRSKNMFPIAINLLESGRAPLESLIANCELCKWSELEGAFKLALSEGNNGPRKAIVKCQLYE